MPLVYSASLICDLCANTLPPHAHQEITQTGDLQWNFDRYYVVSRTGDVTFYEGNTPMGLESVVQYYLDEVPDL